MNHSKYIWFFGYCVAVLGVENPIPNPKPVYYSAVYTEIFRDSKMEDSIKPPKKVEFFHYRDYFYQHMSLADESHFRFDEHCIVRNGEKFMFFEEADYNEPYGLRLISDRANPKLESQHRAVYGHVSSPIQGCLGVWFFEDYFPAKKTFKKIENEVTRFESKTKLGHAIAWMDIEHHQIPRKIEIRTKPSDLIFEDVKLGEWFMDNRDPESRLSSLVTEMLVERIGITEFGQPYIERCSLESQWESENGRTRTNRAEWEVEKIEFDPDYVKPEMIFPIRIRDRTEVSVEGAPQLPYVWSEQEQWAVPDVRYAAAAVRMGSSQRFYYVAAAVALLVLACALVYWKQRR